MCDWDGQKRGSVNRQHMETWKLVSMCWVSVWFLDTSVYCIYFGKNICVSQHTTVLSVNVEDIRLHHSFLSIFTSQKEVTILPHCLFVSLQKSTKMNGSFFMKLGARTGSRPTLCACVTGCSWFPLKWLFRLGGAGSSTGLHLSFHKGFTLNDLWFVMLTWAYK